MSRKVYRRYYVNVVCKHTKQKGFLVPVALFIIVGMSALAIAISRLSAQSSNSSFREGISAQALLAAESGAQLAMHKLFFPDANRDAASVECVNMNNDLISFSVPGLSACSSLISCSVSSSSDGTRSYFTVSSEGSCGSGELLAERIIKTSAYLQ